MPVQPFILLSKSARGAAAAGLVEKATAAPAVYVFAELLQQPSIKDVCPPLRSLETDHPGTNAQSPPALQLANQEQHVKSYRLLQLFAYGTWADYNGPSPAPFARILRSDSALYAAENRDQYPQLSREQETKLKHLTILSLAATSRVSPRTRLLMTPPSRSRAHSS